jgi:hypothetical protein
MICNMATATNIYQKIIAFQEIMQPIKKSAKNPFFKSNYAPLDVIQETIRPDLAKVGLGYIQTTCEGGLKTTLFDVEGRTIEFVYPCNLTGKAQDIGSSITYAKRYSLVALLGLIVEDDDDDGNAATTPTVKKLTDQEFEKLKTQNPTVITQYLNSSKISMTQNQRDELTNLL